MVHANFDIRFVLRVHEGDDEMRYTDINWTIYMGGNVCKELNGDSSEIPLFTVSYEVVE